MAIQRLYCPMLLYCTVATWCRKEVTFGAFHGINGIGQDMIM